MMHSSGIGPIRHVGPQRETSKESNVKPQSRFDANKNKEDVLQSGRIRSLVPKSTAKVFVSGDNQEDLPITPPSEGVTTVNANDVNIKAFNSQRDQPELSTRPQMNVVASLGVGPGNVPKEVQRKVHFSSNTVATSREMEMGAGNQVDTSASINQEWQHHNFQSTEIDNSLRSEGGISLMAGRAMNVQDQLHRFENFLQNDLNNVMTPSSLIGSSCVTSTLVNSNSAPMISSTTYCSQSQVGRAHLEKRPAGEVEGKMDIVQPSYSLSKNAGQVVAHQSAVATQPTSSVAATATEVNISSDPCKELQTSLPHDCSTANIYSREENNSVKENVPNAKFQLPPSDKKSESLKSEKLERVATGTTSSTSRKKGYDPDVFFKVNGKHYQRLGKIGRGGSSEVHKVISSDCTIYALKKIKLKGRDYATAYGFCQEIEYLNKLKGMNNIIQLVDYEVTDKTLLREVMNGSMSNKESKVRDDGFIYMVLEYGEIDLAHMLAQKWKELDESNSTIDESWLRFYWQQILRAVNTIHEERIVHSDLKPANFLLVRGSLKLIDFGIAKAIMSDTTNIQRDSQVGTLSYMSPEAFMCNETDANGNTIKCGRPSDIWSLGCILYQMVYGRTPFSEYRTFWAKFKVMTDPNHEIIYEPLPNPWLLDLMKKCLAWDRNERWRIPQLLQHPFLVPPVPPKSPRPPLTMIFSQLQSMLKDPQAVMQAKSSMSKDQLCKLVIEISTAFQLQEQLGGSS